MKTIKLEAHLHTAEVSRCAVASAAEIMDQCKRQGYGAVIVTDHFLPGRFTTRAERAHFLDGYRHAKERGESLGMRVLPGMEYRMETGMEDFLVYGMHETDFADLPDDLCSMSLETFYHFCCDRGWLVYQAHPFRRGMRVQDPRWLHGVEVYNGNTRHLDHNFNEQSLAFAREHHLLQVVGTDVHEVGDVGGSALYVPEDLLTPEGFIAFLKAHREIRGVCSPAF